jgi:hypothetical protein
MQGLFPGVVLKVLIKEHHNKQAAHDVTLKLRLGFSCIQNHHVGLIQERRHPRNLLS